MCHDLAVTEPADAPAASRLAGARPLVAIAVAAALVLAGGWWSTHPSRFLPVGNEVGAKAAIGTPIVFSTEAFPSSSVVLRGAEARIREDTANAVVRVVFCTGSKEFGAFTGTAKEHCGRVIPVKGAHLGPDRGSGRQLMVEVTLRQPGTVVLDGVDVSYRSGPRLGSETTGLVIQVESR